MGERDAKLQPQEKHEPACDAVTETSAPSSSSERVPQPPEASTELAGASRIAARPARLVVFDYLNYRNFLRDYYEQRKARSSGFSYRVFSRIASLGSPNYLKLVIDGDRNLTPEMAARFAKACQLSDDETAYFIDLVAFNQAHDNSQRESQYHKLTGFKKYRDAHKLDMAHAELYAHWYIPAIYELASRADFRADAAWIAPRLKPAISKRDAIRAIKVLTELGLLVPDAERGLHKAHPMLSTGAETRGVHIFNFHRDTLDRARGALESLPAHERDISSVTLCMNADGIARLKRRIAQFRKELLELAECESDPEQVVQLNLQLIPLSTRKDEEPCDD